MENLEYFKLIASPLEPVLEGIMKSNHKVSFKCSEFKANLIICQNGFRQTVDKIVILSSFYVNYLLAFYLAKTNVTEDSFGDVLKIMNYISVIHKKLNEDVDPNNIKNFVDSFNDMTNSILSSESNIEIQELILAYIRIYLRKNMFD